MMYAIVIDSQKTERFDYFLFTNHPFGHQTRWGLGSTPCPHRKPVFSETAMGREGHGLSTFEKQSKQTFIRRETLLETCRLVVEPSWCCRKANIEPCIRITGAAATCHCSWRKPRPSSITVKEVNQVDMERRQQGSR